MLRRSTSAPEQALSESKRLEREIDAEIKRVNDKMINGGVLF